MLVCKIINGFKHSFYFNFQYMFYHDEFPYGKFQGDVNPLLRGFRFSAMS